MRGLFLKDVYTNRRNLKVFLLFGVLMMCIPNISGAIFIFVFVSMFPVTALAYDERSKWDILASMMPYTKREIVASKYLLGYMGMLLSIVFCTICEIIKSVIFKSSFGFIEFSGLVSMALILNIVSAASLPVFFRYGVEKARILFYMFAGAVCGLAGVVGSCIRNVDVVKDLDMLLIFIIAIVVNVVVNLLSVSISSRVYRTRRG